MEVGRGESKNEGEGNILVAWKQKKGTRKVGEGRQGRTLGVNKL